MFDSIPIQTIAVSYVALLLSLSVHESAHAASAYWLEDDTAKRLGRMTLNPLPHIDILGTLVLPLMGMVTGWRVLGWAKPVPVDPRNLTRKFTQRTGMAMIAGAGPASNLLLSFLCIPILALAISYLVADLPPMSPNELARIKLFVFVRAIDLPVEHLFGLLKEVFDAPESGSALVFAIAFLGKMLIINIGLAIFNLLPFGPLDGASILRGFLPWRMVGSFDRVQPTLSIVILFLFLLGPIKYILSPLFSFALSFYIIPLARLLFGA